jgi:hypothetical protein
MLVLTAICALARDLPGTPRRSPIAALPRLLVGLVRRLLKGMTSTPKEVLQMFKVISSLSVFGGLALAVALGDAATPAAHVGSLKVVLATTSAAPGNESGPVRLTITSLDRAFKTRVELPRDTARDAVHLALPPGLYAVEGAARVAPNADESTLSALSAPGLVVVVPGRESSVSVHDVDLSELASAVAVLDAEFAE